MQAIIVALIGLAGSALGSILGMMASEKSTITGIAAIQRAAPVIRSGFSVIETRRKANDDPRAFD